VNSSAVPAVTADTSKPTAAVTVESKVNSVSESEIKRVQTANFAAAVTGQVAAAASAVSVASPQERVLPRREVGPNVQTEAEKPVGVRAEIAQNQVGSPIGMESDVEEASADERSEYEDGDMPEGDYQEEVELPGDPPDRL